MSKEEEKDKEMSFEVALKTLEETVAKMEQGELSLDENIKCFESGNKLAEFCEKQLHKAEKKVEILLGRNNDGSGNYTDFNPN
jgi:exodeoxyribonuclease VII small subunit